MILAKPVFALSKEHCINLTEQITQVTNQLTAAINAQYDTAQHWRRLLQINADHEKECPAFVSDEIIAKSIGSQAEALFYLGNPKAALTTANRCLTLRELADCHLIKGQALVALDGISEGKKSIQKAQALAHKEITAATTNARRAITELDRRSWTAHREKYRSLEHLATVLLSKLDETEPQSKVRKTLVRESSLPATEDTDKPSRCLRMQKG